jgi:tetratricopeptide (TPR) repeat protein
VSCFRRPEYFAIDRGGPGLCLCATGASRGGARAAGGGDQRNDQHGQAASSFLLVAWHSEVCRLAGDHEEAWQCARQALDLARQHKERGNEALALHQLGAVQAHAAPPDAEQAEAYYQQALALAEALGMRPLQAHCHHDLGTLYAKTGLREQARAELSAAITLYRAMDMTFWLPEAEAALAQVEGR